MHLYTHIYKISFHKSKTLYCFVGGSSSHSYKGKMVQLWRRIMKMSKVEKRGNTQITIGQYRNKRSSLKYMIFLTCMTLGVEKSK